MPFLLFLTGGLRLYEENMCVSNQKISVQGKKICLQPIQPRHKRSWTEARKKEGNFPVDWTSSGDTFFVMQVAYNAPGLPILSNPNCGDYFILDTSWGLAKITIWLLFLVCIGKRPNFPKNYSKLMQEKRYSRIITKLFNFNLFIYPTHHTSRKCIKSCFERISDENSCIVLS